MTDLRDLSPSISVALCTYNGMRFLQQQLDSIATQSRLPDELVVFDDCSTDETVDLLHAFAAAAPFAVRVGVNEVTLGSIRNFGRAIAECRGDVIALADQDDIWKPDKLAVLSQALLDRPEAGYAFSNAELIDQAGVSMSTTLWESIRFAPDSFRPAEQVATLLRRNAATGATMAFRSMLKSLVLPISDCFVHDYWIALLFSVFSQPGIPISKCLIEYRQHNGQQIGTRQMGVIEKIKWVRQVGPTEYKKRTQAYLDLQNRLQRAQQEGVTVIPEHLFLVRQKIEHCSRRADAHAAGGFAKIGRVFSEFLTGRYGQFSNSWQSVAEDLCF